ncbi:MAG: UDP-N-acetylmuramoyl-L-alanyl-D-glutamate--2,6-diaminopimelate ligase [Candidatus Omnitrophica bacterium]|nr:UDP-N-acetylmuramoyl-L-alanyl-D-glutamate--2,6-diaminopimelate ligase [Candidatus Omnitrophota bacterium]
MIKLERLLNGFEYVKNSASRDIEINKIETDSRLVEKRDLFVAISGSDKDGHDYIAGALKRGAAALVIEKDYTDNSRDVSRVRDRQPYVIKVKDSRKALALLARNFYGDPSKDIKVIGITGTNGKTTITYLLENILNAAAFKTGIVGTIRYKIADRIIDAGNTTPSCLVLQGLIKDMLACSVDYCVMEVSSHGLDQHRTDYIDFDTALFINATREHLDYHKTFERYLDSKARLFEGLEADAACVLNRDDPNYRFFKKASSTKRIISFGINKDADVYADNIKRDINGSSFTIHRDKEKAIIKTRLIGAHNIYNMLAAASCAISEDIGLDKIKEGLEKVGAIEGRLQLLDASLGIKIFVDYAHTDDALEKVLTALKELKRKKLITVFGCGGNRDRGKRPRMGRVAATLSDRVIITSDNPRFEEPNDIVRDIIKGIDKDLNNFEVILDRRDAIKEALSSAEEDDIVLIAGKGHERYQIVKDKKIPFNDREVAEEFIEEKRSVEAL